MNSTARLFMAMVAAQLAASAGIAEEPDTFQFEKFEDHPDRKRAEEVDAALRESFPPGIQLTKVVKGLQGASATCSWHNRTGDISRYICKHARKMGGFKSQITTVYILFETETCDVTDYKIGTGMKFGLGAGKMMSVRKNPAAHCFKKED